MNKAKRLRPSAVLLTTILCMTFVPGARSDVAAEALQEIYGATAGFALCFGTGTPVMADVHPSPGDEILYLRKKIILKSDTDADNNRVLKHVVSVIVKSSSTQQVLYETGALTVNSRDIVLPLGDGFQIPVIFNPGAFARFVGFLLFPLQSECTSLTVAVHGGTPYIVIAAGTTAAQGTPQSGTDFTKIRLRIVNGTNGVAVRTFNVYAKPNVYVAPFLPALADIDDDGNIEVLEWRASVNSPTQIKLVLKSFDLLSGALESQGTVLINDTLTIE